MPDTNRIRGYIGSRTYHRELPPQSIQNQIVRDFCARQNGVFLLSLTEYAMPDCYILLNEVLRELDEINGLALYSIFMLPTCPTHRGVFVTTLLENQVSIYGAAENVCIHSHTDWYAIDDMLCLHHLLESHNS